MAVYLIADTHFEHENIIKYENRPFNSSEHMTKEIAKFWNAKVKKQDKVFILGDFALTTKEKTENIISKLNGKKHLIMGNHDRGRSVSWWKNVGFDEVSEFPIIYKDFFMLSHEPLYINNNMPYANIFGHVHSSPAYATVTEQTYCVSVERINYTPINFEEIKKAMENMKVLDLFNVLLDREMVQSRAEYRRLITQKAIIVNEKIRTDLFDEKVKKGDIIQIGKSRKAIVGEENDS